MTALAAPAFTPPAAPSYSLPPRGRRAVGDAGSPFARRRDHPRRRRQPPSRRSVATPAPQPPRRRAAPGASPLRGLRAETPQEGFALQVGAFSQSENTQKLIAELAARGFEPYVVRTATRASQHVESVRIGHFASRSEAAAASSELARAEGIRAFVVRASGIVQ